MQANREMKIAILDDVQDVVKQLRCFELLKEHEVKVFTTSASGIGQLALRLAPFDVLVPIRERTRFSRSLLQKLPQLKIISQTGRVCGHIDLEAAQEFGIRILEGGTDPSAPAELTWALIMAASRKIVQYTDNLHKGRWQMVSSDPAYNSLGQSLKNKTLAIWGYGRIGTLVAAYGRAFGMQVLVWGSAASRQQAVADGYQAAASRHQFFSEADVLTLHLRLSETTRHCIGYEDFSCMKPQALFVNTSRAALVAQDVLLQALQSGRRMALDVFDTEPLPKDSQLLVFPHLLMTPHLGYVEQASYEMIFEAAFRNILSAVHP